MRNLRFWIDTVAASSRNDPPRFVESVMVVFVILTLVASVIFPQDEPYLVLCLSLAIGLSISILVREANDLRRASFAPSHEALISRLMAFLLLVISFYGFADMFQNLS
jgi:hypothetical protein